MGRKRLVERDAILEAALRVLRREGTAGLSIEAVACEAGISKAGVLYDFKTKQAMIHAIVEHQIEAHQERLHACRESLSGNGDCEILATIAAAQRSFSDEDRAAIVGLCASVLQDEDLRDLVKGYNRELMDSAVESAANPRNARLAFLAVEGLMSMERFHLHCWSERERREMIDDILSLASSTGEMQHA